MPYNSTLITLQERSQAQAQYHYRVLARLKKIIAADDDDISSCSNNAAFVITVAAETLQHVVEQSYNIVKSERKSRWNIQHRNVANAVSRVDNLEFFGDVVSKTTTNCARKQKQRQKPVREPAEGASNGPGAGGLGRPELHILVGWQVKIKEVMVLKSANASFTEYDTNIVKRQADSIQGWAYAAVGPPR